MANVILTIELLMGTALLIGMLLARARRFRAHAFCQTMVVILNLVPIAYFMFPAFRKTVVPALPSGLHDRFYLVTSAHATIGAIAELLGIYIILVAGTELLPGGLRFTNYKRWMRTELVLWWLVIALGVGTYWVWNVGQATGHKADTNSVTVADAGPGSSGKTIAKTVTVAIGNFAFDPKELQIEAGTTVVWKNIKGRHTVSADDGTFDSPILADGEEFRRTFDQKGRIQYFCKLHGAAGGHEMSASLIVK